MTETNSAEILADRLKASLERFQVVSRENNELREALAHEFNRNHPNFPEGCSGCKLVDKFIGGNR